MRCSFSSSRASAVAFRFAWNWELTTAIFSNNKAETAPVIVINNQRLTSGGGGGGGPSSTLSARFLSACSNAATLGAEGLAELSKGGAFVVALGPESNRLSSKAPYV